MIKTSLDWAATETNLRKQARNLSNRSDLVKMISNIKPLITRLSNAEISARRGAKTEADELLSRINAEIQHVEEYILIATLIG